MATPKELSIEKMKCFLKGGANGDELDEGLLEKLIEVAGNGQPSLVPLPLNKPVTGKAFRRLVNKIPGISGDEVELVADWFEEEYPLASPAFNKALPSVDFAPPGNIALDTSAPTIGIAGLTTQLGQHSTLEQLTQEMQICASKQMLPNGGACAALTFAIHAGRLPSDGMPPVFGSEVRMTTEYKTLCKLAIDNLKMAMDKGTRLALDAYFESLMEQLQDSGQPAMQSRVAVWYNNARTTFPGIESRIEYLKAYLNKHQGKGLPELIDLSLVLRFKVMRDGQEDSRHGRDGKTTKADDSDAAALRKELESARQSADDLRQQNARLKGQTDKSDKSDKKCGYCGKNNHTTAQCLFKKADQKKALKKKEAEAEGEQGEQEEE